MTRTTALIDGNNFYAACEQSIDPSLTNRPLVILSNNDGCIIARSTEARDLGIKMGQPYFKFQQELKRQGVVVRSSNYSLYGDMSQRLMSLLESHCEQVEVYSIDEAFAYINFSTNKELISWARKLRTLVRQSLGLPISIGLGASKGQAKIANHLAKAMPTHAGIFNLITTKDLDSQLATIKIEDVWGIGHKLSHWCRLQGINTALELREMSSSQLYAKCGVVGIRLQNELRGQECLPLSMAVKAKQETCVSRSFSHPITNLEGLQHAIASHAVRASEKLRQHKQYARAITVFARTSRFNSSFYSQTATTKLDMPSNDTKIILEACLKLTKQIFQPHKALIKAGVLMQGLQSDHYQQQNLLTSTLNQTKKRERLMNTIDNLNHRYGNGTINWAICLKNQPWNTSHDNLSHAATTRIKEIPIVKA